MLTPRQREVAALYADGKSYKQIARETGLSCNTVRNHLSNAAERIPGDQTPRRKMVLFFQLSDAEAA